LHGHVDSMNASPSLNTTIRTSSRGKRSLLVWTRPFRSLRGSICWTWSTRVFSARWRWM